MRKYRIIWGIGLLLAVFFWHCSREKPEPVPPEMAKEIALLPESPTGLGYVRMEALRQNPLYAVIRDSLKHSCDQDQDYREFVEMTGLEITRDVKEIYFAVVAPGGEEKPAFLIVIKGTFQPEKIMDFVRKQDENRELREEEYRGIHLFTSAEEGFAFCLPSPDRLVWGDIRLTKNYLDVLNRPVSSGQLEETATLELIRPLPFKSDGWLVVNVPPVFRAVKEKIEHHRKTPQLDGFKSLQQVSLSVKLQQDVRFSGVSRFDDAQKAGLFYDAVKGFISSLKLAASDDRRAVDVLNKIHVRHRNRDVDVRFQLSVKDIKRLLKRKTDWDF